MSNPPIQTSDELEIAEAQNSLFELLYDFAARGMSTRAGQFVYRRVDNLLSKMEKTARWSVPQTPAIDDGSGKLSISAPPLVRPLPWILFLPALIALRLVRVALSLLALMVGRQPVYPSTVVTFLQTRRRKLRALKYRGQKLDRISSIERQVEGKLRTTWLSRIILPLRTAVPSAEVHHHQHHHHHEPAKKRNAAERDAEDSDDSSEEGSVLELLDKYADKAGDSSFNVEDASQESSSDSYISENEEPTIAEKSPLPVQPDRQITNDTSELKEMGAVSKQSVGEHKKSQDTKESVGSEKATDPTQTEKHNKVEKSNKSDRVEKDTFTNGNEATSGTLADGFVENGSTEVSKHEEAKNVYGSSRSKSAGNLEKEQALNCSSNSSKSVPILSSPENENNENRPMNANVLPTKEQLDYVVKEDDSKSLKSAHVSLTDVKTNMPQKTKQHHSQQANGNVGKKNRNRPSHNYY
ncbi:uncharacterized protein LOC129764908 [Toxorhynchites rutilus septentrionalis]|uniref:uncharacterized protein LOC129764908 n=1 Tax=Toxorhynchites rutilus septentrionalis TaxID=329112 RepID=UPI00247A5040|nr:uncharacterized protein LOC129764908 [Toxorhynchites rutilus septentrionalis]XP_055620518.1 uncharacterized protein LOC129764908 [Toxorhynchites rutilus septentrionalis]